MSQPTRLHVVEALDDWLQAHPSKPSIADPSAPTATFDHRWDDDTYAILREDVHRYWDLIHEAFNAAGPDASRALGQDIFGTRFRTPNLSRTPVASERSRRSRVGPAAPDDPPAFRPNRPFSRRPRSPNSATSPQPAGRRWTRGHQDRYGRYRTCGESRGLDRLTTGQH